MFEKLFVFSIVCEEKENRQEIIGKEVSKTILYTWKAQSSLDICFSSTELKLGSDTSVSVWKFEEKLYFRARTRIFHHCHGVA